MRIDQPLQPVPDVVPEAVRRFCAIESPYAPDAEHDELFIQAMREITILHIERSPWYRRFAAQAGVNPAKIQTMADVFALPPVHANFFKFHEIRSIHASQVKVHLTSSGTTGQKSQIFFDDFTFTSARLMAEHTMVSRGMRSSEPANYLINGYEPHPDLKVGTSNTFAHIMSYAPVAKQFWSLRYAGNNQHEFDAAGTAAQLEEWAQTNTPVRIVGFPAFLHFLLEHRRALGRPDLRLPTGSLALFGGGWKGYANKAIPKTEFYEQIEQQLGIPGERIVETFGSVEHSVPYADCQHHHLHQPTWSRVLIRDLRTLEPVPDGKPGFLSFVSPYITATPAHSVVMGDMAMRHPAGSCSLPGYPTPWFEILGRAGTSTNKSCAVAAAELLGA